MAYTKEQKREYRLKHREEINAKKREQYRKNHPKDNTNYINVFSLIYYSFTTATNPLIEKRYSDDLQINQSDNWSDVFAINEQAIAQFFQIDRSTVHRILMKLCKEGYLKYICPHCYDDTNKHKIVICYQANTVLMRQSEYLDNNYKNKVYDYYKSVANKVEEKENNKLFTKFLEENPWAGEYNTEFAHFLDLDNKGVVQHGRYYTELCRTLNPDNHEDKPLNRYYELDKYYGLEPLTSYEEYQDRYAECDIKSMSVRTIINILNWLQDKEFIDNDIDIYYEVYKKLSFSINIDNSEFIRLGMRDIVKIELQKITQLPQSVFQKVSSYNTYDKEEIIAKFNNKENLTKKELIVLQVFELDTKVKNIFGVNVQQFLEELQYEFYELIRYGVNQRLFLGKKFYQIEGCIYGEMQKYFSELGVVVYNVYDGWYGKKTELTNELLNKAYEYSLTKVLNLLTKSQIISNYVATYNYSKHDYCNKLLHYPTKFQNDEFTHYMTLFVKQYKYNSFINSNSNYSFEFTKTKINNSIRVLDDLETIDKKISSVKESINNNWFGFYPIINVSTKNVVNQSNFSGIKNDSITQDEYEKIRARMSAKKQQKGVM